MRVRYSADCSEGKCLHFIICHNRPQLGENDEISRSEPACLSLLAFPSPFESLNVTALKCGWSENVPIILFEIFRTIVLKCGWRPYETMWDHMWSDETVWDHLGAHPYVLKCDIWFRCSRVGDEKFVEFVEFVEYVESPVDSVEAFGFMLARDLSITSDRSLR